MASSRVGATTNGGGPGPLTAISRSAMARWTTRVFPKPVGAWMTTSRPRSRGGMASTWTVTGVSTEFFARAVSRWAFTPRSANVVVKRVLLGPLYLSLYWPRSSGHRLGTGRRTESGRPQNLGGREQEYQLWPRPKPPSLVDGLRESARRHRSGCRVFLERLPLEGNVGDVDPLRRCFKELQHLVVVVAGSGSIRILDVALLVLEPDDPNDPVGVLVLDRELARDPPGRGIRASLVLGILAKRVLLSSLNLRPHDRPVHGIPPLITSILPAPPSYTGAGCGQTYHGTITP